jgi:hypothetical protein
MTSGPSKQRWLSALGGRNEGVFPHHCGTELCKHQDSRQPGSGTQGLPENNRHISSFHSVTVNGFSHGTLQLMWFLVSFIGHGELQRIVREDGGPNSAVLSAQWMPSGALIFQPWTCQGFGALLHRLRFAIRTWTSVVAGRQEVVGMIEWSMCGVYGNG